MFASLEPLYSLRGDDMMEIYWKFALFHLVKPIPQMCTPSFLFVQFDFHLLVLQFAGEFVETGNAAVKSGNF
ncbi:unnamed protein product [Cuscuta epithymum]|uniref:Uncharacterized protein n=1 Tax=Cuscuta epithymum TaxID=186058 RepID=A0AAV0DFD3_9ASTE|nr:unnamed protein product [Cuscuta epithymum]